MRIALAVKSAAMPDVLSGKDLLQGNGLSQAGGALAQIFGIVFGGALAGFVPPFVPAVVGAVVLLLGRSSRSGCATPSCARTRPRSARRPRRSCATSSPA